MRLQDFDAKEKIKIILEKLLHYYYLDEINPSRLSVKSDFLTSGTNIDKYQLSRILNHLEKRGIIDNIVKKLDGIVYANSETDKFSLVEMDIPKTFVARVEDYLEILSEEIPKSNKNRQVGFIIYLNENGELWHGDRNNFCYPMASSKGRFEIIKFLVENKGVQETSFIASSLEKKNQNIRSEIGKIRSKIKSLLKLDDVIENKQNGYRINPKYKIIFTKD